MTGEKNPQRPTARMRAVANEERRQVGLWRITVRGYGAFLWVGTDSDVEKMRAHKAKWEGGVGHKDWLRNATPDELERWNEQGAFDPE